MNPTVKTALDALTAALEASSGDPAVPVAAVSPFWRPTDAHATALATRTGWTLHDLLGSRQGSIQPCDGSDADACLYAAFGFWPTGLRYLWSNDSRESAATLCDRVVPLSAQSADNVLYGAGQVEPSCRAYLIMTGNVTGGGLVGSPRLGLGGATTIARAVAILMGLTTGGSSVSGR